MSARMKFDLDVVDSLPALLCAIHHTARLAEDNAASHDMTVDWSAPVVVNATRMDGQVVVTVDPTYTLDEESA